MKNSVQECVKFVYYFMQIKMSPNASGSIRDLFEQEVPRIHLIEEDEPESFIITRARLDGSINIEDVVDIYENTGNVTPELESTLQFIPPMQFFLACINCTFPIAYSDVVSDVINNVKHPSIPAAYVVQMYELIHLNVNITSVSNIFWQTHLKCVNCGISLTIRALNQYNVQVDEYTNEHFCIMFDSSCVDFLCKHAI